MSKVSDLQARAAKAYDAEDQRWFDTLPEIDLGVLWGLACSEGVAYDDEVYEALDRRGWFDEPCNMLDRPHLRHDYTRQVDGGEVTHHSCPGKDRAKGCVCATHNDGSVTTSTCPVHADQDPCLTMSLITGRRRTGTIRRGTCTACGHTSRKG